jgi:hypothetical protein
MAVKDRNVAKDAVVASDKAVVAIVTAISQTGVVAFKYTPGYAFQVTRVRTYNLAKAGAVAGNLKIGTRTAVALVFTTASEVAHVLSTTLANVQGSASEAITIEYTTDGSGVLTNGFVVIEFRPRPMNGEGAI